ncbi:hypothetical protein [Modestobacter lapidis]|nr:hypothetical protein [Modestobacter lapidis]
MSRRPAGWLAAAGACAGAALGLPWQPLVPGTAAPARVFVALAVVLVVVGVRTGRGRLLSLAVLTGAGGVLAGGALGGGTALTPGRVALAVAVGCLVAALRCDGRPVS